MPPTVIAASFPKTCAAACITDSAITGLTSSHHNWGIVGYKMGPFPRFMDMLEYTPVLDNPDSWEGWHWGATHSWGFFWRLGMPEQYDLLEDSMKNAMRLVMAIALVLGIGPQAWADFSIDQAPTPRRDRRAVVVDRMQRGEPQRPRSPEQRLIVELEEHALDDAARRREVALLKALGWRTDEVVARSLAESTVLAALGISVSLMLGFRTSAAYDRWWEARKVWGAIVNDSRTFVRQLEGFIDKKPLWEKAQQLFAQNELLRRHAFGAPLARLGCAWLSCAARRRP